ncbi:MAG: MmgE/PrpD family protein [Rhodospirillales bacterium]|jgi:2-methylcitrate dehydratase PrpD
MEVTRPLARYIVGFRLEDTPPAVQREGVRAFVNWMGSVLGGSSDIALDKAMAAWAPFSGPEQATCIGRGRRFDILTSAFLNTFANFTHSYNDTHLVTVAHPTGATAGAAFARAELVPTSGREFLEALILGNEVTCRIGNMLAAPPAKCPVGLSTTGVTSVFGAMAATALRIGLDETQTVYAIGNACTQAGGVRSAHGSMTSHVVSAYMARNGMISAFLGEQGFTCSENTIEGAKGLGDVFANPANPAAVVDRLGEHFEVLNIVYKPFPSGVVNHAPIDACLRLHRQDGFRAEDVDHVELDVHPLVIALTDRPRPRNQFEGTVSYQHWAAVSLITGKAGLTEGSDRWVNDPAVADLRLRIKATARPDMASVAATATAFMKDSSRRVSHVDHCIGSIERQMTDAELSDKFLGQAVMMMPASAAERLLDACWTVADCKDVGAIARDLLATDLRPKAA